MPANRHHASFLSIARLTIAAGALFAIVNCGGGGAGDTASTAQAPSPSQPGAPSEPNAPPQTASTVIAIENAKQGTGNWALVNPATGGEIEGYASANSVDRGGAIDFHIRTTADSYRIDIFRMGYYGGAGGRHMLAASGLRRQQQPMPCAGPNGLIECDWRVSYRLQVPGNVSDPAAAGYWASGIYLAKLSTETDPVRDSYIIFVVRDDARTATYVSQLPVTTYQAYNFWGGKSLYTGCGANIQSGNNIQNGWRCPDGTPPASAVSFNRPYGRSAVASAVQGLGAGEFITNVQPANAATYDISSAAWDYNMVRWMERQGYDLKYITNLDLHEDASVLNRAKAFISTGHDEYYSKAMWDRLVDAKSAGINLAFFSANQIFWQVRFADGAYGASRRNRTMICYRGGGDPVTDDSLRTDQFRYLGRPEAGLIGNQYVRDPIVGDVTVTNASHWLFAGSGASNGTVLRGLLGYEINAHVPGVSPAQTRILAHSVANGFPSDITYYVDASSAQVFSTGTMQWAWGLDNYIPGQLRADYVSPIAQRMTANLFNAIGERGLTLLGNAGAGLDAAIKAGDLEGGAAVLQSRQSSQAKTNQWRILSTGDGAYMRIVSRANGLCLAANGAQAVTRDCDGSNAEKWRFEGDAILAHSGACLTGVAAGAALGLATCNGVSLQRWMRTGID